jgi:hypothetical protein
MKGLKYSFLTHFEIFLDSVTYLCNSTFNIFVMRIFSLAENVGKIFNA